jgi:hypothetical protein
MLANQNRFQFGEIGEAIKENMHCTKAVLAKTINNFINVDIFDLQFVEFPIVDAYVSLTLKKNHIR